MRRKIEQGVSKSITVWIGGAKSKGSGLILPRRDNLSVGDRRVVDRRNRNGYHGRNRIDDAVVDLIAEGIGHGQEVLVCRRLPPGVRLHGELADHGHASSDRQRGRVQ